MPRSGVIGEQIYDEVEKLVGTGLTRTQAFAQISSESGRRAGTVAANYYRVARKRGTTSTGSRRGRRRRTTTATTARRTTTRRRASASTASASDVDALAGRLVTDVQALAAALNAKSAEVREMRDRLDRVKSLLS
ncbi:MAG: hypothetical protein ACTHNU_09395 [Gaiellales bacterium]